MGCLSGVFVACNYGSNNSAWHIEILFERLTFGSRALRRFIQNQGLLEGAFMQDYEDAAWQNPFESPDVGDVVKEAEGRVLRMLLV